jgi:hypothetical protein
MARLEVSLTAAALVLSVPFSLAAQAVQGTVVDATNGVPVGTGFVVLLNEDSVEVARALTSSEGRFDLAAPNSGVYRLRSERIGYGTFVSDPFQLLSDTILTLSLEVTALPVRLDVVEVAGEDRCHVNPERALATGLIWEEIRKALAATAWSGTQELYHYRRYSYTRDLSANRRRITKETGRTREGVTAQPYMSLPAAQLAADGYIVRRGNENWYYVPDARVLLDDAFLSTHCFHVVRDSVEHPGRVGLAFEPTPDRSVTEVRGALWLDESTSELHKLEVAYTELPGNVADERAGATVEFMKIPSGAWIVQRWQARTPLIHVRVRGNAVEGARRQEAVINGFQDIGGEILEITASDGSKIYPATLAHIIGPIFDSTKSQPLAGGHVVIAGTDFWTSTDRNGEFHLAVPLEGEYTVSFAHPWLDSIGLDSPEITVDLARERTDTVVVTIPHSNTMAAHLCGTSSNRQDLRVVVGRVAGSDHEAVSGARVTASWQEVVPDDERFTIRDMQQVGETDDAGFFVLCGLPVGRPVSIKADHRRRKSRTANVIFPRMAEGDLLYAWDRRPDQAYSYSHPAPPPIWMVNLGMGIDDEPGTTTISQALLSGLVVDRASGQGLEGVAVSLNGRESVVSREDGTFDLVAAQWARGANTISFRRTGYRNWVQELWIDESEAQVTLSVLLEPTAVIALEPIEVSATAVQYLDDVGFSERRERGLGRFMDRQGIESRLGAARDIGDLLTAIPGVIIVPDGRDGMSGTLLRVTGMPSGPGGGCTAPNLFVDDRQIPFDTFESLAQVIQPEEVIGMEIYRSPSEMPAKYGGAESGCGVVLIWTNQGNRKPF